MSATLRFGDGATATIEDGAWLESGDPFWTVERLSHLPSFASAAFGDYDYQLATEAAAVVGGTVPGPRPHATGTDVEGLVKPVELREANARAFTGRTVPHKMRWTDAQTGELGEAIAIAYLKRTQAAVAHAGRGHYALDLVTTDFGVEVKAGTIANGKASRHWRLTIGEPSESEKAYRIVAQSVEKLALHQDQMHRIMLRKQAALQELSDKVGRALKPKTITCILDPARQLVDVFEFDGWHARIGWETPQATRGYRGSYLYTPVVHVRTTVTSLGQRPNPEAGGRFGDSGGAALTVRKVNDEAVNRYKAMSGGGDVNAALDRLAAALPGAKQGTAWHQGNGVSLGVSVDSGVDSQIDEENGSVELEVHPGGDGYFQSLFLPKAQQDQGTAKKAVAAVMQTFEEAGVKKPGLSAAKVGLYVWARLGAKLGDPGDRTSASEAAKELYDELKGLKTTPVDRAVMRDVYAKPDKATFARRLADASYGGQRVGKALLLKAGDEGVQWEGHFDLTDKTTQARLKEYSGWQPTKK